MPPGGGDETPKPTGYRAHDIDLASRTRLHWVETPLGAWVVSLADRMLRVRADGQGTFRLEVRKRDEKVYTRVVDRLSQEFCFGIASDTAEMPTFCIWSGQGHAGARILPARSKRRWRGSLACGSKQGGPVVRSPMRLSASLGTGMTRSPR